MDRGMKVASKRCTECLFSDNRVVSRGRAKSIMAKVVAEDSFFECHKAAEVVCRGSFDLHKGQLIRIAQRLGVIEYVDPDSP